MLDTAQFQAFVTSVASTSGFTNINQFSQPSINALSIWQGDLIGFSRTLLVTLIQQGVVTINTVPEKLAIVQVAPLNPQKPCVKITDTVTGEQAQQAMFFQLEKHNVIQEAAFKVGSLTKSWVIRKCSMCDTALYYFIRDNQLYFSSQCDCSRAYSPPQPRDFSDIANTINMQTHEDSKRKFLELFGFTITNSEEISNG